MARKNTRKTQGVRRQARAQGNSQRARNARKKGQSLLGRVLAMLPFTTEQLTRAFVVVILGGVAAGGIWLADRSGATAVVNDRVAHMAANAGFKVVHVEPRGIERMNANTVYEIAFNQRDLAMTRVDMQSLRAQLMEQPWVLDARVSRQLPDTLVVNIIEREPHAVLQRPDRLMLIDATGHELEPISEANAAEYMRIAGPGAQQQVEALDQLLDAAPALKERVRSAEWVGNRRWDLTFETGQLLALPDGDERASAALISFAQADGQHRLLGGEVVGFDMRNPPRMFMRVPGREQRQELEMQQEDS